MLNTILDSIVKLKLYNPNKGRKVTLDDIMDYAEKTPEMQHSVQGFIDWLIKG